MEKRYSSSLKFDDYIIVAIFLLLAIVGVVIYLTHPSLAIVLLLPVGMIIYTAIMLIPQLSQKLILENEALHFSSLGVKSWDVDIHNIAMIDEAQNNGYVGKYTFGSRGGNTVGFSISTSTGEQKIVLNEIDNYQNFIKDVQTINPEIKLGKITTFFNQKFLEEMRAKKVI